MKKTLRQIMLPILESGKLTSIKRPKVGAAKLTSLWNNLLEMDDYGAMEMEPPATDATATPAGDGAVDMSHEDHLAHMLKAIVQDEDMSPEEKIDKITKALKLLEEPEAEAPAEGAETAAETSEAEEEDADVRSDKAGVGKGKDKAAEFANKMESQEITEYKQLKAEKGCRNLCETLDYVPDAIDLKALTGMSSDVDRKAYIRKQKDTVAKPKKVVAAGTGITRQVREAAEASTYMPGKELDTKKCVAYWKN